MKIKCTTQEFESLQKSRELLNSEKQLASVTGQLNQKTQENWELQDTNSNLKFQLEELQHQLAQAESQPDNQFAETRVRYLSTANRNKLNEIIAFLNAGQKVGAIKAYRELTGLGLRESKDACEARQYAKSF